MTANRVLALASDPDVDLRDLARVMELDPAFAGDILFLANSWLFGFPSRVLSVRHAVALLGLERIKALAVTAAMRSFLGKANALVRQCWRHSAACAIIAEEISPMFRAPADNAYTLGLLHDVGRLALLKAYPSESAKVLKNSFNDAAESLEEERATMTVDHCAAGAWLTQKWRLPEEFANVCAHHHEPVSRNDPGVLQVSKVACCLADALGFAALKYTRTPNQEDFPSHIGRDLLPTGEELKSRVEARLLAFD
jgi:putative nucleotidyltransferase with HDIG domain